jgi:nanoRNase/pAp phosphatase (c-di-AMP/oligoRNAs hydrolase)
MAVEKAELVHFEGHDIYFANCHPLKPLKSLVGNKLAQKTGTMGLVVSAHPKGYGVSIRSVGDIDVAAIAFKYGGNGHTHAAGFAISADGPLPWVHIEKNDEDSRN